MQLRVPIATLAPSALRRPRGRARRLDGSPRGHRGGPIRTRRGCPGEPFGSGAGHTRAADRSAAEPPGEPARSVAGPARPGPQQCPGKGGLGRDASTAPNAESRGYSGSGTTRTRPNEAAPDRMPSQVIRAGNPSARPASAVSGAGAVPGARAAGAAESSRGNASHRPRTRPPVPESQGPRLRCW